MGENGGLGRLDDVKVGRIYPNASIKSAGVFEKMSKNEQKCAKIYKNIHENDKNIQEMHGFWHDFNTPLRK